MTTVSVQELVVRRSAGADDSPSFYALPVVVVGSSNEPAEGRTGGKRVDGDPRDNPS